MYPVHTKWPASGEHGVSGRLAARHVALDTTSVTARARTPRHSITVKYVMDPGLNRPTATTDPVKVGDLYECIHNEIVNTLYWEWTLYLKSLGELNIWRLFYAFSQIRCRVKYENMVCNVCKTLWGNSTDSRRTCSRQLSHCFHCLSRAAND